MVSNRGANGIDGLVSSGIGAAAASGRPTTILTGDLARSILHGAIAECARQRPFSLDAMVLLPDHLHSHWTLPPGDATMPFVVSSI